MASVLTADEEQSIVEFIEKANAIRQQWNAGPIPWNGAVKFLMARKFDVTRALDLYEAHEITRAKEKLVKIEPESPQLKKELSTGKFTILPTRDSNGAAIALFSAAHHVPHFTSHQVVLQSVVYQLDCALESVETQRNGLVFIYDMSNSKYSNFDYELSTKILTLLKGGYPARLKKVMITAAPLWFKAPFNILRLFVRQKLRDRVVLVSTSEMVLHISKHSLPKQHHGTLQVDHAAWLCHCSKLFANQSAYLCDVTPFLSSLTASGGSSEGGSDEGTKNFQNNKHVSQTSSTTLNNTGLPCLPMNECSHGSNDILVGIIPAKQNNCTVQEKQENETQEKEVPVRREHVVVDGGSNGDAMDLNFGGYTETQDIVSLATECMKGDIPVENAPPPPVKRKYLSGGIVQGESIQLADETQGHTIEEFVVYVRETGRNGLYRDYSVIKSTLPEGAFDISRQRYNLCKNRYTDVLCQDETRVQLSLIHGDISSDYINANYVDGYKQKNAFVSTQGPLPKTFPDFWRMIWELQVLTIVMTTRTVERGRVKCGQYWPVECHSVEQFGNFSVENANFVQCRDYSVTTLLLTNKQSNEFREVTHLQFLSWPDYGVPHSANAMLDFLMKVREHQRDVMQEEMKFPGHAWKGHETGPPIVVHCSAGIGRTGTFITLDTCIQRLADVGKIDVEGTVKRIRSQRAFSIQMPDQYVFCHLALIEYALNQGVLDDVDLTGFDDDSDSEEDSD